MAQYATLKAAIDAVIKANGQREITGTVLNQTLNAMVNSLGANYQFAGLATPSTNPGTPDQNVFYLAGQGGTYTNFNNIAIPNGISFLLWNGSWSSQTVLSGDGGVFDISAYKATGGTLATFADLSAALGENGENVPIKFGGMQVRFVSSSDNKYVQYRLMSDTFSTTESDWQGVDAVPTLRSDNLVKSGGVAKSLEGINHEEKNNFNDDNIIIYDKYDNTIIEIAKDGTKTNDLTILKDGKEYNVLSSLEGIEHKQESQSDDSLDFQDDNGNSVVKINRDGFDMKGTKVNIQKDETNHIETVEIVDDNEQIILKASPQGTVTNDLTVIKNGVSYNIVEELIGGNIVKMHRDTKNIAIQMPWDSTDGNHEMIEMSNPSFVFFSDLHAATNNLNRIIELTGSWKSDVNIKSILNGGDLVSSNNSDGSINGYDTIISNSPCDFLSVIGNHDAYADTNHTWDTNQNVYNIFKNLIKGDNIVKPDGAAVNGLFYYYKDYDSVRVIVLNTGHYYDNDEDTWLRSVLADAVTNRKTVMIVQHYPFRCVVSGEQPDTPNNKAVKVNCSFTQKTIQLYSDTAENTLNNDVCVAVNDFMNNGGKFICYLAGHTHYDGFYKHLDFPNQYMFITGSANYSKFYHEIKSSDVTNILYDQFNIVSVSTKFGLLKILRVGANLGTELEEKNVLTFDYVNRQIINNY